MALSLAAQMNGVAKRELMDFVSRCKPSQLALDAAQQWELERQLAYVTHQGQELRQLLGIPFVEQYVVEQELAYLRRRFVQLSGELGRVAYQSRLAELSMANQEKLEALIGLALYDVNDYLNVTHKLSPAMVESIASDLCRLRIGLTYEGLLHALYKGRQGHYGEIYRLDGAVIMRWVMAFHQEQCQAFASRNQRLRDEMASYSNPHREREKDAADRELHQLKVSEVVKRMGR